uniref:Cyclic nucleotide-binding domain-containing protein n=1 Tax=Rhodnius prolixus TaxID=13249 RepID=T1IFG6_RHOPR
MQTRHCVRAILIEMYKVFIEEKLTGKYSEQELKCFEDEFKKMNTMADEIKLLKPEPVIGFLQKIKWIRKNFIQLFERNAIFRHFDYGKYIIERGTDPSGLYIIVSGLVKLEYRPTDSTLMRLVVHGELPNCDHLATLEFQRPHDLILSRGTLLGELGIVTGRRFDMNVKCETFVEAYHISSKFLVKMFHDADYSDVITGEIWASIGRHWASYLLKKTQPYTVYEIHN